MRLGVNSTGLRLHFGVKFHFDVRQLHYQRSHEFGRSETHFGANFGQIDRSEISSRSEFSL